MFHDGKGLRRLSVVSAGQCYLREHMVPVLHLRGTARVAIGGARPIYSFVNGLTTVGGGTNKEMCRRLVVSLLLGPDGPDICASHGSDSI